eukprot:5457656-Pyramimonas_sp.AAC.1
MGRSAGLAACSPRSGGAAGVPATAAQRQRGPRAGRGGDARASTQGPPARRAMRALPGRAWRLPTTDPRCQARRPPRATARPGALEVQLRASN